MTTARPVARDVVVYHNPSCSNSRGVIALLHERGMTGDGSVRKSFYSAVLASKAKQRVEI